MLRDGYEPEMGLGQNGDSTTSLVKFFENYGRFGLGYEPTHADKRRVALERKERSLAHLQGWRPQMERVPICDISKSFVSARSNNESCESSDTENPDVDFKQLVNEAEEEENEDWELPPDLRRMVEQEEREVKLHREETEVVNLGIGEEKKKVKVGTHMPANVRDKLVTLLGDYQDIFAWSYQDMPDKDGTRGYGKDNLHHSMGNLLLQGDVIWAEERWGNIPAVMVALFHNMMHKEIEVYVNDMITKSRTEEEHLVNLQKLFGWLRKYRLRLNPTKCTFRVKSKILLGFVVSQKGIEVDPDKVKAILEMPKPRTEKQVRGFLGRLKYIARFISQLTATCEPFFRLLHKNQSVQWDDDCQVAFERIKRSLMNPPVLMPPVPGRPIILYMTVLDESMGCVLGQHDEPGKKGTGHLLLEQEVHNMRDELLVAREDVLCLGVGSSPFEAVYVELHYLVLLSEFDIVYVTQKAIKGSTLADYLAQQPISDYLSMHPEFPDEDIMALFEEEVEEEDKDKWVVWFDGVSNALGHGIGAVLVSPDKQYIPFTVRLCFDCTNNIIEYEAYALGIRAAIDFRVKLVKVYGDSTLVIHQLKGEWETRDHKLVPYQVYIRKLMELFDDISFHHIPRDENQMADALTTLSSMFKVSPHEDLPYIKFRCRVDPAYCCLIEQE
ncbi:uncharacterized protein LOC114384068 [Glycine soja]|uniref:uncharacterized protein LOC114384068 n=1 Tax=Glycine soja TaxID=3848 RepID=UPI00103E6D21|nr:uncharacterized protein LOC114384068 [Glycine soja]